MKWLSECTIAQLQSIARAIGSNTGGTKASLGSHLRDELQRDRFTLPRGSKHSRAGQHRIVSIDMGIRNLAMCTVVVPEDWHSEQKTTVPLVQHWTRIGVSKKAAAETPAEEVDRAATKEAFDPRTYAQHAYDLVSSCILPHGPSQILIERQRFRSMGGSAVQEWTLRVNMFEAMIYASLKTFSEQKLWNGSVHAVTPAKISKFWLGDDGGSVGSSGPKGSKTKSAKIALVGDWLSTGQQCEFEGEAVDIAQAYRAKLAGRAKRAKGEQDVRAKRDLGRPAIGKLDDLADCLLQAMAWIRWEENRRALISEERKVMDTFVRRDDTARRSRKPKQVIP